MKSCNLKFKIKVYQFILIFTFLGVFGMAKNSEAATLYVAPASASPAGNDSSGDGSIQKPWLTFKKAMQNAYAGDTVYFRQGTYVLDSTIDTYNQGGHDGTESSPITFSSYPGETATIDCNGLYSGQELVGTIYLRNDGWVIKNLHFINYYTAISIGAPSGHNLTYTSIEDCVAVAHSGGQAGDNIGFVYVHSLDGINAGVHILNNDITGPGLSSDGIPGNVNGIVCFYYLPGLRVLNNVVRNTPVGIHYKLPNLNQDDDIEIAYNFVEDSDSFSYLFTCNHAKIHDNIAGYTANGILVNEGSGTAGGNNNEIYHNTFVEDSRSPQDAEAIAVKFVDGGGGQGNIFRDNIFRKPLSIWKYQPGTTNTTSDHNLFPASGTAVYVYYRTPHTLDEWKALGSQDQNSIGGNPIFKGSDWSKIPSYELADGSPGKNVASDGKDMGADITLVGPDAGESGDITPPEAPMGLSVN